MRMGQGINFQNLDPSDVRKAICIGSVITLLSFLAICKPTTYCESCLTDKNFFLKNCHLRYSNTSPILPMLLPSLLFNIYFTLVCINPCSSLFKELSKVRRRIYWNVKNQYTGSDFKNFLHILGKHGKITNHKFADGVIKQCIALEGSVWSQNFVSNIEFADGSTYIYLAPVIFREVKKAIENRDNLINTGISR